MVIGSVVLAVIDAVTLAITDSEKLVVIEASAGGVADWQGGRLS